MPKKEGERGWQQMEREGERENRRKTRGGKNGRRFRTEWWRREEREIKVAEGPALLPSISSELLQREGERERGSHWLGHQALIDSTAAATHTHTHTHAHTEYSGNYNSLRAPRQARGGTELFPAVVQLRGPPTLHVRKGHFVDCDAKIWI